MRRVTPVVLAVLALAACKERPAPAADPPAATPAPADAAMPPDLGFLRGDVIVSATERGITRPLRLDAATGAWIALGSGDVSLFPTEHRVRGGLLCIATWGTDEVDHGEQLAIVRGPAVERFGPTAKMVRNPSPTPDGARIVAETDAQSFRDLYAIAADGKATRLTNDAEGNFEPAVSPDGSTVVFASSRDGNAELYATDLAGSAAIRLTTMARDDWGVGWSRDGARLVFLSDRDGAQRIYLMAARGGEATRLTTETAPAAVEEQPRWSPDGTTLAYLRGEGTALSVVLVDVAGGGARTITPAGRADLDFAWSPDGAHLAVIRHADRTPASPAAVTFVRVSDGVAVASVATDASLVRWVAE